jgi:glyoxylase-like metal-dependent hydrolase (beta-lactamase superfamily II)/rhodanese-related sulfurtransferase
MEIQRFYLGCLAHASYVISSGTEAAVVDPQRDVDIYLDYAAEHGLSIRWIVETHLHADFISGHVELAERTGATICLGAGSGASFPHRALADEERLPLGSGLLRVMSTPGHTLESICIAVIEPGRTPETIAVITGDTLFIGDVGRPDLSPAHTPQQLAGMLFDSLHRKLLTLPDSTVVYPAHGAGSLCGRQMSSEAQSTIGRERADNYALQAKTREQFVDLLTSELPARPAYFADEVERNRSGARPLADWQPLPELSADEVETLQADPNVVVLDTRPAVQFGAAHVPGAVNIGLSGQFASWAARLLGLQTPVVLVAEDENSVNESRMRLARVGIENLRGSLAGGLPGWIKAGKPVSSLMQVSVQELAEWRRERPAEMTLLDVREAGEYRAGRMEGSVHIPLGQLVPRMEELSRNGMLFVHCKGGYRSSAAASLLLRGGFTQVGNVTGGYDAWQTAFPGVY